MKVFFVLLFTLNLISNAQGQSIDEEKLLSHNWVCDLFSNGNFQQRLNQRYSFDFNADGRGILNANITYSSDGEDDILYFGNVKFTYELVYSPDSSSTKVQINYQNLDLKLMPNWQRRGENVHDISLIQNIKETISNKEVSYAIELTGSYLVIEDFEQDEQNTFSYFTNNPISQDRNY
ncbi:MAG: hypothetical protein AB8F74_09370 [Saprospiraceae bacterium]